MAAFSAQRRGAAPDCPEAAPHTSEAGLSAGRHPLFGLKALGSPYASAGISAPAARVPAIWPETNVQDWAWPPHGV